MTPWSDSQPKLTYIVHTAVLVQKACPHILVTSSFLIDSTCDAYSLRFICGIKWQQKIPDTEVLQQCNIPGIEALLMKVQLHWCDHLVRMSDHWLPKQVFFGELSAGMVIQSDATQTVSRLTYVAVISRRKIGSLSPRTAANQGLWTIEYLNTGRANSPKIWLFSLVPVAPQVGVVVTNWH